MTIGSVLAIATAAVLVSLMASLIAPRAWLSAQLAGTLAGLAAAIWVLATGDAWEWRSTLLVAGEIVHLRLDGLSALFLALLAVVGGAGAAYSQEYWTERVHRVSAKRGRFGWSALLLCLGLVLLCSNGLHFLIAWELFALSAFFLITLDGQRRDVRAAGWLYLAASHAGTLGFFALGQHDLKRLLAYHSVENIGIILMTMISILEFLTRLAVWLLLAPLLPGVINKVKAWVAGRRGPPMLQLYYDLARLWRKGVVLSTLVSPGFIAGPALAWVAVLAAGLLLPLGPLGASLSFRGDVILAGIEAPLRAQWLRAIALELERLANHTGDLGALAGDVRFDHPAGWFRFAQVPVSVWPDGDVFARARVRWLEIGCGATRSPIRRSTTGPGWGWLCAGRPFRTSRCATRAST